MPWYGMKKGHLEVTVTWLDMVLGWLCGLCGPTGGWYGGRKVWTCSTEVQGGCCARIALGCIAIGSRRGPRLVESQVRVTSPRKWGTRVRRGVHRGWAKVHGCVTNCTGLCHTSHTSRFCDTF